MATKSFTIAPISDTDANWRLWVQAIIDALTDCNWIDTAATGQIDVVTSVRPTATNQFRANYWKVFRMNDALQATAPCFLKVWFGSGNVSTAVGITLQIGNVHDGAGTLSAQATTAIQCAAITTSASLLQCWASGDAGRFAMAWCADNTTNNYGNLWSVERTVDGTGTPNGDGIVLALNGVAAASQTTRSQTMPQSGGLPPVLTGWVMPLPLTAGGFANGADVEFPVTFMMPHVGRLLRPVLNWAAVHPTDMPTYAATVSITVYGSAHTYMSLGTNYANVAINATALCRLLMRYE